MKITYFEVEEWERPIIEKTFPEAQLVHDKLTADNSGDYADVEVASCFIYSKFTREAMDKMPNLKMVATRSTGFDHVDLEAAKERGIQVVNVPEYGSITVAEYAVALMINLSRKIYQSVNQAKQLHFEHHDLRGFDLAGKTLGIVGLGKIGSHVAQIANGFGMNIVVTNRTHYEDLAVKYGFKYVELDDLLAMSDIVTLHLPYNEHTHHTINRSNITKFKKGALIINTARGGLVETEALLMGLDKNIIEGVGLDVLEGEKDMTEEVEVLTHEFRNSEQLKTLVINHVLINHPKVLITPHNAFNSIEALMRIQNTTFDNINGFISGDVQNSVIK